jgi:hypothetical protein
MTTKAAVLAGWARMAESIMNGATKTCVIAVIVPLLHLVGCADETDEVPEFELDVEYTSEGCPHDSGSGESIYYDGCSSGDSMCSVAFECPGDPNETCTEVRDCIDLN